MSNEAKHTEESRKAASRVRYRVEPSSLFPGRYKINDTFPGGLVTVWSNLGEAKAKKIAAKLNRENKGK